MHTKPHIGAIALLLVLFLLQSNTGLVWSAENKSQQQDRQKISAKQAVELADDILAANNGDKATAAQALTMRSLARLDLRDYSAALNDARLAVKLAPMSPQPLMARAWAASQVGGWEQARNDLKKVARMDPGFYKSHGGPLLRAICLILLRRPDAIAVTDLGQVLSEKAKDARLWLLLGRAKLDQGDGAGAFEALSKAIELDGGLSPAFYWRARVWSECPNTPQTNSKQALEDINSFLVENPADGPGLGLHADILSAQGKYRRALRDVRGALDSLGAPPSDQRGLFILEQLFWSLDLENKKLISLNIAETTGLIDRPRFAPAAEALYTAALSFNKENEYALTRRGRARLYQGRAWAAVQDLKKARALGQRTLLNGLLLSQALRLAYPPGREALPVLEEVLADHPDNTDALLMRAQINMDLGNVNSAALDLRKALKNDPVSAQAALLLARALEQLHQPEQALKVLDEAAKIHAGRGDIQMARGRLLLETHQYPAALETLNKAVEWKAGSAKTFFLRAKVCMKLGRTAEAKGNLTKAIELRPYFIEAMDELDRLQGIDH